MEETIVDTQVASPDGAKVDEPTKDQVIVDETVKAAEEEAKVAEKVKTKAEEEIIEKAFQKTASWMGRRDSELLNKVSEIVNEKIAAAKEEQEPPATATAESAAEKLFENPRQWLNHELNEREQKIENYTRAVVASAGKMMDADPLMADKEFGKEVAMEIRQNIGNLDGRVPPQMAAKVLVSDGIANVYRRQTNKKTNPLKSNTPATDALGNVSGAAAASKTSVIMPKISDRAKEYADKWGYKEEDLARIFGED